MMYRLAALGALVVVFAGCDSAPQQAEKAPESKPPALDKALIDLKDSIKDTAAAAKEHIAQNAGEEFEKLFAEMQDIATNFGDHAEELQGDARKQYDDVRMEYDKKKEEFEAALKQLKEGTSEEKQELVKRLYDALSGMKSALDKAAAAFRESAPKRDAAS